ncbi:hypothetical protein ACFPRL_24585 [Pseudoclavibacter helvolus]
MFRRCRRRRRRRVRRRAHQAGPGCPLLWLGVRLRPVHGERRPDGHRRAQRSWRRSRPPARACHRRRRL